MLTTYGHNILTMKDKIIELYVNQKLSMISVCKAVRMAPKTVRKILLDNGHEIRSKNATRQHDIDEVLLRKLYINNDLSYVQIAKKLGVSNGTVHNYLKKFKLNNKQPLWDAARLERCRQLLLEHKEYQTVADILGCSRSAVENKNRENWNIPMSIWTEQEDEIKAYLETTRNYADTAYKFNLSEVALQYKNNRCWHIDLSMNSTLFGIHTIYNGTQYRSKKEAIIAQYLTEQNVSFEYERKVKDGHNWTCDFYLPKYDIWIEYDGLELGRSSTKSIPYNRDNPKIRFYQENGYRHMILSKRTWKQQLDSFLTN